MLRFNGSDFCNARSAYRDRVSRSEEETAKIYIRIEIEGSMVAAQVDTGCPWTVLETTIAADVGLLDADGTTTVLSSRAGRIVGRLHRLPVTLLADLGPTLTLQATVFVSDDWPYGTFIGYNGLLERIRFAVDPATNQFYFGPIE